MRSNKTNITPNEHADIKIFEKLKKKYPGCLALINYGSRAIEQESANSDFDILLIIKNGKTEKINFRFNKNKVAANVISLSNLKLDANYKYKYYYVSKLINPGRYYYQEDIKQELLIVVKKFMLHFLNQLIPKGKYDKQTIIDLFLSEYQNVHPFFYNYQKKRIGMGIKIQKKFLLDCLKNKEPIKIIGVKNQVIASFNRQKMLMEWTIYGYDLRKHKKYFPTKYIAKQFK